MRNRFRSRYILALPDYPDPKSELYKIAHRLGYRLTQKSNLHADLTIAWEDCTVRTRDTALEKLSVTRKVINHRIKDISKQHLAPAFAQIFGYPIQVNPEENSGPMVRKSDRNARHDGTIVHGPTRPEDGFVFERLIDNEVDGRFQEVRVSVVGREFPTGVLQSYTSDCRFNLNRGTATLVEIADWFTPQEVDQLRAFCELIGLDYGALDVLRDAANGRIYVVDVNNTPFGPINGRSDISPYFDRVSWRALNRLCYAFVVAFGDKKQTKAPLFSNAVAAVSASLL